jgi:hypothetical protein
MKGVKGSIQLQNAECGLRNENSEIRVPKSEIDSMRSAELK